MTLSSLTRKLTFLTTFGVVLSSFGLFASSVQAAPQFVPATLPDGHVDAFYERSIRLDSSEVAVWSISAGTLPPGIVQSTAYEEAFINIKGTPTTAGTYTFTVRAASLSIMGAAYTREYTVVIKPMEIEQTSLPNGQVGADYSQPVWVAGGRAPYEWTVSSGTLPTGVTFSRTTGWFSGSPTAAGTYTFTINAKDSNGVNANRPFTLTVNPRTIITPPILTPAPTINPLAITTTVGANGTVGMDYYTSLAATGGTAPYRWNFASGALPPGITLSSNGVLSGRPTSAGSYTAYLEVFDATNAYVGRNFTFSIASAPSTPSTPTPSSPELTNRLNNLSRIGVSVHALVKLPDDGNRFTQADSAVYYVGGDGRRHAFPNDRVFSTWYSDFNGVRVVSQSDLASIPLGANVTYKPGVKLVKFATDPKVYAVSSNRVLRWVKTEAAAQGLYGSTWNRQVDDVFDTFYGDYSFGSNIETSSDYNRTSIQASARYVSDSLPL